ncbi:MAG: hypothetical protein MJA30_00260 [Cytophagales bacterium]|nr:hypothetical protein [Cytophagales bacterium]
MKIRSLAWMDVSVLIGMSCAQENGEKEPMPWQEMHHDVPPGVTTRWISPENPTGEKGKARSRFIWMGIKTMQAWYRRASKTTLEVVTGKGFTQIDTGGEAWTTIIRFQTK